jgi:cell wall-associated NlpC family hydrolase
MQPIRHSVPLICLFSMLTLSACSNTPEHGASVSVRAPATPAGSASPDAAQPSRRAVVAAARDMLGKPYRYGGEDPRGFDCSGLVWYSHQRAGIEVPRTTQSQMSSIRQVSRNALQAGDLLFFRISGKRDYHVGIYIGDGTFIHAPSSGKRVSTSSLDEPYWDARLLRTGHYY